MKTQCLVAVMSFVLSFVAVAYPILADCPVANYMFCSSNSLYWCSDVNATPTLLITCASNQMCIAYQWGGSYGGGCQCPSTNFMFCMNNNLYWCSFAGSQATLLEECLAGQTCVTPTNTSGTCSGTPTVTTTAIPPSFTGIICNPTNSSQILSCNTGVCNLLASCPFGTTCGGIPATCSAPFVPVTNPTGPIPAINQTDFELSGYGWVLPFFSPMFLSTLVLVFLSGISAKYGGMVAGSIVAVALTFVFTVFQIYPAWIGIVMILIGGVVFVKFGTSILSG
jgi:hypothetical protein